MAYYLVAVVGVVLSGWAGFIWVWCRADKSAKPKDNADTH